MSKENEDLVNKMMTDEEILEATEKNEFLKLNLKIMNGLELLSKEDEEEPDYNELAKNIALNEKKLSVVEYNPESMSFYYSLITNGYDCFGEDYIYKLIMEYPEYTALILHLFIDYAAENTKYISELENKIKELEANK